MLRRSAKAIFAEVVDRVLERRADERAPPWSERAARSGASRSPAPPNPRTTARSADDTQRMTMPEPRVVESGRSDDTVRMEVPVPHVAATSRSADDTVRMMTPFAADHEIGTALDEPILTRTMAGVLAAQGYHERVLRIYDHLLGARPDDDDLEAEADAVRGRMAEGDGPPEDEVAAVPVKQDALLVSWKVTPRSIERARAVLGGEGKLTARVVVVARGRGANLASETLEHPAVAETGEHLFTSIPRRARCTASVGLLANERFVSVAHSRVVPT
jgi:hypothetical protein